MVEQASSVCALLAEELIDAIYEGPRCSVLFRFPPLSFAYTLPFARFHMRSPTGCEAQVICPGLTEMTAFKLC